MWKQPKWVYGRSKIQTRNVLNHNSVRHFATHIQGKRVSHNSCIEVGTLARAACPARVRETAPAESLSSIQSLKKVKNLLVDQSSIYGHRL